jgi:hypothetical protein
MDGLRVDNSHIRKLLDETATRQGIIAALVALRVNDDVEHSKANLIYCSGHDGETYTLDEWTTESTENRIQSIIPQDFDEGKGVHLITDQSFVWLIEDIMRKRGANMVCPGEHILMYIPNDLFPLGRHP